MEPKRHPDRYRSEALPEPKRNASLSIGMAASASTHDAHAARTLAPLCLADMPPEVIERMLASAPELPTLIAANATSRLFRGAPGSRSPVEHALRERVRARGHERALPAALPPDACSWTEELFARERVLQLACTHRHAVACGQAANEANILLSAFVDAEGGLHTCGEEAEEDEVSLLPTGEYRSNRALGHDAVSPVLVPTRVASLSAVRVVAVAAGCTHLLGLSEAGAVYGCGDNRRGQLGLGDWKRRRAFELTRASDIQLVVAIAAGTDHSLALTAAGGAYSWGYNYYGQLGHGDREDRWEPTRIEALGGVHVAGLVAGGVHTLVLSASCAVYSCGRGYKGQLGHGDGQSQCTPRRIEALAGVRALHVSAGRMHSLVVDSDGAVHSFGAGDRRQLGHVGVECCAMPTRIAALAGVRAVRACAGGYGSAVMCADGGVYTFGDNSFGQLCAPAGFGARHVLLPAPFPTAALEPVRVLACALGGLHALYVTADGDVYSCGMPSAALGLGRSAEEYADDEVSLVDAPARIGQLPRLSC